ncbi:ComEA family DNA-binding protein [Saccharibacillus alkalitolerans]|uniref:ComEA family DNA-binding protein n=1 Tax=Saccharibacillus alkalitolerans TaxID=2705290 RepID=A0ABX0EYI6_9BACL|nr:ComEA family DNA-binding protein [Saccharibacillus alkalitolerans]NGZ73806.1 ComEA family DNA-binding protein [Saccharibacillus alkalitolerans]
MKKEWLWAGCLSAVLGAGVLLFAGGTEPEGGPWEPLNAKIQQVLSASEGTASQEDRRKEEAANPKNDVRKIAESDHAPKKASGTASAKKEADAEAKTAVQEIASAPAGGTGSALPAGRSEAEPAADSGEPVSPPADEGKIRLNSADAAALMELPGIGEKKAQAILDYRAQHGPFRDVTDIVKVKGIGPKMLEKMLPDLAL